MSAQENVVVIVSALFVAALVMFAHPMLAFDNDPLMHIAVGQWILTHGTVPLSDHFSYTFVGQPWNAHEWLSEALLAVVYQAGGMGAVYALFGLAAGGTALLVAMTLLRFLPPIPAVITLTLPLAFLGENVQARPHILALPILVLWMAVLLAARQEQRAPRWILIPLMVLWVNLHGSFILGFVLLAWFMVETWLAHESALVARRWALVSISALAAALLNPAGLSGLLFPFKLMGIPALSRMILEWQPASFPSTFETCLLAALFFCLMRGVKMPAIRLLLLLGLLHEALEHRRHTMIAVLLGAMLLAEPIAATLKPKARGEVDERRPFLVSAGGLLLFLMVAVRLAVGVPILDGPFRPIAALSHVPDAIARQPVFNDLNLGAYMIFKGIPPFIDARVELYGDAFLANYNKIVAAQDAGALRETFSKYGVVWTIFTTDHPFNRVLDGLPGWRVLYRDKFAVVHVRDGGAY